MFSVVLVFSMLGLGRISDIRSCCRQSAHVFTSRYDSTLLGRAFFYTKGVLDEIQYTDKTVFFVLCNSCPIQYICLLFKYFSVHMNKITFLTRVVRRIDVFLYKATP